MATDKPGGNPAQLTARSARLPLNAVRMFDAVAKHGSFTTAAEALHVTTAAVSMQIKSLENYLEVQLFRRGRRDAQLTSEGEALLPYVQRGLDELEQGFRMVKLARGGGALVVSTVASILHKWLLPRMGALRSAYPEIHLQVRTSPELVDFARDDVQVAIRMGTGEWPALHVEKLLDDWLVAICSPALYARYGALPKVGDTGPYPLLHSSSEPWSLWRRGTTTDDFIDEWPREGTAFDDSVSVVEAAEQGQGLALARWLIAADAVAAGRVVMAYPHGVPFPRSYYFVCPPAYLDVAKVAKFRGWLFDAAAQWQAP
jgi:LysR family transcriptional regulator, glycine cleavage system transcriptional activator